MILITNDDGIGANGIKALTDVARGFDCVVVFAPDGPRSGMSSALTCRTAIRYKKIGTTGNVELYSCTGTPTDCVKLASQTVLKDIKREEILVLSGINHGSNASVNIIYSGTMGAALEANVSGMDAIGFSVCSWDSELDLEPSKDVVDYVLRRYYEGEYAQYYKQTNADVPVCLNVNIPVGDVKGITVCNQARATWERNYDARIGEDGEEEFVLTGDFINLDEGREDTDLYALSQGMASVVPVTSDMTLRHCAERG